MDTGEMNNDMDAIYQLLRQANALAHKYAATGAKEAIEGSDVTYAMNRLTETLMRCGMPISNNPIVTKIRNAATMAIDNVE